MSTLKFSGNKSDFYSDLKQRVQRYFEERKINVHGGTKALVKAIVLLSSFIGLYILLAFNLLSLPWNILACVLFALVTAGIGFNIMHDGAHGSLSSHPLVNRLAALTLNMLGASAFMWNIKHNVIHHTFTNVDDHDDDILNQPLFRMSPGQPKRLIHRYQHIYWPIAYGLMYMAWVFWLDIRKYFRKEIAYRADIRIPLKDHLGFWLTKIIYVFIFIVVPLQYYHWTEWLAGYLIFGFSTGLIISIVFQLAHTVQETIFVEPDLESNVLPSDWASHQVKTTANFATTNPIITWFTGGLNFQVEHHLFPRISHVHYPQLSKIVQETCREYGLNYLVQPTLSKAISSHVRFLHDLGR